MINNPKDFCPYCKKHMMLLSSYRVKICYDCKREFEWNLDEKQHPLVKHQR